jgi:hypothetical protein
MKPERWDCIFVHRIDNKTGRIYLTAPHEYGYMSTTEREKGKKAMLGACGIIEDSSNDSKVLKATSRAIAFNYERIITSNGLIVRGFESKRPIVFHREDETFDKKFTWPKQTMAQETNGWLIYISPEFEIYYIDEDGESIGERLDMESEGKICSCTKYILEGLSRWNPKFGDALSKFDQKSLVCA